MGKIKVHAGDFPHTAAGVYGNTFTFPKTQGFGIDKVPLSELISVEVASEENVKKIGGSVGWGVAGAVLLGPLGLLAGLLGGGRKKEVTFVAVFKDGRRLLATTDSKTYTQLLAATF